MNDITLWKFVHILLLVFWLGTDLGVLILSRQFKDSSLSVETRVVLLQMAMVIDTLPRICFVLMLPAGVHLGNAIGFFNMTAIELSGFWIVAVILLTVNVMAAKHMGQDLGQTLQKINWALLGLTGITLMGVGFWLYLSGQADVFSWLYIKIAIYGMVFFLAIGIDRAFMPVGQQVIQLIESGSSPELEKDISKTITGSLIYVHLVYFAVLLAAFLGTTKISV